MTQPTAIVVGVGALEGVGAAVTRRFAREGYHVFAAGRTQAKLDAVAAAVAQDGAGSAEPIVADATSEEAVVALFARAFTPAAGKAIPDVVVFNAGDNRPVPFRDITPAQFEAFWRIGCYAGFVVGRQAAKHLVPLGRGTIIFTGASGSLRGKQNFAHFAAAKAGLRMIAQSMAREFGPQGIHVAHTIIDGGIDGARLNTAAPGLKDMRGENGMLQVEPIADAYWQLHKQHPSAWSQELELRPFKEPW